jgi:L-alanine-DL-glutamate epimerase-like enolase superfamily enzyme
MRITDINLTWLRIPMSDSVIMGGAHDYYRGTYHDLSTEALQEMLRPGTVNSAVVQISTDEGIVGLGECEEPFFTVGVDKLRSCLVGVDPFDIQAIIERLLPPRGAPRTKELTAIEMACWDIMGKKAGLPVYKLMGGAVRDKVAITRFLGIKPVEQMVADVVRAAEAGVKTMKVKAGLNHQRDLETLKAIREAVGDYIEIRVDVNGAWSVPTAIDMINRMEQYGLQYVEGPLPNWDWDGLARVKARTGVPLCICTGLNGDGVLSPGTVLARLMDLIKKDAIDVISTDPMRAGGMLGFRKLCAVCEAAGIPVVMHWSRSGISQSAWLHCCVSNNATMYAQDILCSNLEPGGIDDIITEPFEHVDGYLTVREGPGLGVALDEMKVAKYAFAEH